MLSKRGHAGGEPRRPRAGGSRARAKEGSVSRRAGQAMADVARRRAREKPETADCAKESESQGQGPNQKRLPVKLIPICLHRVVWVYIGAD